MEEEFSKQVISGTDVQENIAEDNEEILDEVLRSINENNIKIFEEEDKKFKAQIEEKEAADKKTKEEAMSQLLKERAEKERLEREERERQEEEELRLLEEEQERKRQNNPIFKLTKAVKDVPISSIVNNIKKPKKEKPEKPEKPKKVKKEKTKKEKPAEEMNVKPENKTDIDYEYLATHDENTGLFNIRAYNQRVEQIPEKNLSIIFCDINGLKKVNDTLGHEAGDKLIHGVANTLSKIFPENVYRVGGDEFVILLEGVKEEYITDRILETKKEMSILTNSEENTEHISYSVSIGYCCGDGDISKEEIKSRADKAMYEEKRAYHQKRDISDENNEEDVQEKRADELTQDEYDALLTKNQRELKSTIEECHQPVSEESTERIFMEIQSRYQEIQAILIASKSFNHLFIFRDIRHFMELVTKTDGMIDYSYLYVVYEGGTQYYGSDDYYDIVTDLFKEIADRIKYSRTLSSKDILKIKGINIFQNIYVG